MELYSAYGAATALEKDGQTIVRALRDVVPMTAAEAAGFGLRHS
jgi:hypothetical protein